MTETEIIRKKMEQMDKRKDDSAIYGVIDRVVAIQEQQNQQLANQQRDLGTVIEAVNTLKNTVEQLANRINKPQHINWVGIGSLIISLIAAAFIYGEARLRPVENRIAPIEEGMRVDDAKEQSNSFKLGQLDAFNTISRLELEAAMERQRIMMGQVSTLEARSEMLQDWLVDWISAVDRQGTRDNNLSVPQVLERVKPSSGKKSPKSEFYP